MTTAETVYSITRALDGIGVVAHDEADFSRVVEARLRAAGLEVQPEARLTPRDRIDFLIGRVGVELKTHATLATVIRQLHRYAQSDQVDWIVFVTTSRKLGLGLPRELNGKPITSFIMGAL